MISSLIHQQRLTLGMTQVETASKSGVALPTLQTLEAGTSNPSLDTLERLGRVLGFTLEFKTTPADWVGLSALGLPLMSFQPTSHPASREDLILELRRAIVELDGTDLVDAERKRDAVSGMLLAIFEHFPSFFKESFGRNEAAKVLIKKPDGRMIKLKRLALARIAEYL